MKIICLDVYKINVFKYIKKINRENKLKFLINLKNLKVIKQLIL